MFPRYVAKYRKYSITVRPQIQMVTQDGYPIVSQEQLVVDFQHGGVTEWEKETALAQFKFQGIADGSEAWERLSVLDVGTLAERYQPAELKLIEEFLDKNQGEDFLRIDKPHLPAPWPNYDQLTSAREIAAKVDENGYNPDAVSAYERENLNRSDVLAALEQPVAVGEVVA